ncbi:MAG TPA: nuclease-related domain-containing protein [Chthoniobacterales bacterium]|nr:nuclease-related domain-containing protein [Chthoniobacterales bacterium]
MVFPKKQSVLKVRRTAGQSIRDEKERLIDNWFIPFYFSTGFLWILWLLEESRARNPQPPAPNLFLCLAIIATGISVIVFGRLWRNLRRLSRGERGERRVAEILDDLRGSGYRAFHDLVGDGFNIDHVVVGPAGVFAIETKFEAAPAKSNIEMGRVSFSRVGRSTKKNAIH